MNALRHCFRRLLQAPLFTAIAILTLAIGIGANTIVLSWAETVLWNTIPGADEPNRLVTVVQKYEDDMNGSMSYANVRDFADRTQDIFTGVTAADMAAVNVRVGDAFEWTWAQTVLTDYFDVLQVKPVLGALDFPGDDEASGSSPYAVISHRYWLRRFQGSADVVGKEIEVNGYPITVRGVASEGFRGSLGGLNFDVWVPMAMFEPLGLGQDLSKQSRGRQSYECIARLKPGIAASQIQERLAVLGQQFGQEFPHTPENMRFGTVPMWKAPNGGQEVLLPLLRVLFIVSAVVLLIVMANLGGLVLARATARQREMSIRLAMGASRAHVMKQVLMECLVLALIGGGMAMMLGLLGVGQFSRFLPKSTLPAGYDFGLSWNVLSISLGISLVTGLLFGLLPAWQASRTPAQQVINDAGRGSEGRSRKLWVRRALVASQVAFAFLLVVCAALCIQGVSRSRDVDIGFEPDNLWVASFHLEGLNLSQQEVAGYYERLEAKLDSLGAVESVGFASDLPLGFDGFSGSNFSVVGVDDSDERRYRRMARLTPISDGYLTAMQIPLLAGRNFDARDQSDSPPVAIVNQALVDRHLGDVDPLGKTIQIWNRDWSIVGVVATGKYGDLNERPANFVYFPTTQQNNQNRVAVLRTRGEPQSIARDVERAALETNSEVNVLHAMTMRDHIQPAFMLQNIASTFLSALAGVALLLAALGIYGIAAFNVNRRLREIGIRLALGALPRDVQKQVLNQGVKLVGIGLVIGVGLALAVTGLLSSFLTGVQPRDPMTFATVALILVSVALFACYFPARRASRVDPMEALRCE